MMWTASAARETTLKGQSVIDQGFNALPITAGSLIFRFPWNTQAFLLD
jgi:hypothetical protein